MILRYRRWVSILSLLLLFTPVFIHAQEIPEVQITVSPEKGIWLESEDGFMGFKLGFRLQQQLGLEKSISSSDPASGYFNMRRARYQFKGYMFHKKLDYFIQLGMDKGNTRLFNAEFRWKPDPLTEVTFGQFYPLTGRQFQTVSNKFQFVDRSNVTRFFLTFYEAGIRVRRTIPINDRFQLNSAFSITDGEGLNKPTASGGLAYMGRLEVLPFGAFAKGGDYSESDLAREKTPKLSLGSTFYQNNDAYTKYGNLAWDGLKDTYKEWYIDAVFKYNGFSFLTEYIARDAQNEVLTINPQTTLYSNIISGKGWYAQSGYFLSEKVEIAGRFSFLDPDDPHRKANNTYLDQKKFSLGFNYFYLGHNIKWQCQAGYITESYFGSDDQQSIDFITQFTLSF